MGLTDFFKKGTEKPVPETPKATPADHTQVRKEPAAQQRIYEVQKGDSLSRIAQKYYGDMKQWAKIYEANKQHISDPDKIQIGQKLVIPE